MAILRSALLTARGFVHAFPERGTSDAALLDALAAAWVVSLRQIHGTAVIEAAAVEQEGGATGDAIVDRASSIASGPAGRRAVGVRVADCVPVLVADADRGDVAAIHAGWRGVVGGVVRAAVAQLGARPSAIVAAIGPCIGPCCFEVGSDVAASITGATPASDPVVRRDGDKAFVDLRAAVRAQLRALGVDDAAVDDVAGCTKHESRFHSYRRDGAESGRMLAAIVARRPSHGSDAPGVQEVP